MTFTEALQAAEDARQTQRAADVMVRKTAALIRGRLEVAGVSDQVLCNLKRELANYNMHTGQWK